MKTDVLIIGSGSAGLSVALQLSKLDRLMDITIVTKDEPTESNTKYAQGGIAAVLDGNETSVKQHIKDTLIAGDGLCNKEVVEYVVKNASNRLKEIIEYGANFDREKLGKFSFGKEGGHSQNIILHHKDSTGNEVENTLLSQVLKHENIKILDFCFGIELVTEHHFDKSENKTCYGAYILKAKTGEIDRISSKVTILASGGIGQVYQNTTNPKIATGDGIAMAYRAGVNVSNMEFVQFHPTSLFNSNENPSFLISEAVRGEGAILLNQNKERFMIKYDKRMELASRDIVARAIDTELKTNGEKYVWLDCTHISGFDQKFPSINTKCLSLGINPQKDFIPVVPAAHYICGGIDVDIQGLTNLNNLYACGECSNTGLHGANRLASNSLLEAIVYANSVAESVFSNLSKLKNDKKIPFWDKEGTQNPKELILISHNMEEIKNIMNDYVGIVRSDERLERAKQRIHLIYKETEKLYKQTTLSYQLCELRNLLTIAYLIINDSRKRKENRGGFFNIDLLDLN